MSKSASEMHKTMWEYPLPYPSRSLQHKESDSVGLRALAESVLNLEYQLKVLRRHTLRRLDRIEDRLQRCENVVSFTTRTSTTNTSLVTVEARENMLRGMSSINSTHDALSNGTWGTNDLASEAMEIDCRGETAIGKSYSQNEEAVFTAEYSPSNGRATAKAEKNKNPNDDDDSEGLTPDSKEGQPVLRENMAFHDNTTLKPQRYFVSGMPAVAESPPTIQEPRKPEVIVHHTPRRHQSDSIDGPHPTIPTGVAKQSINGGAKSAPTSSPLPRPPRLQRTLFCPPEARDKPTACQTSQCDYLPAEAKTSAHSLTIEKVLGKPPKMITLSQPTNPTPVARPIYIVPQELYSTGEDADEVANVQSKGSRSMSACEELKRDSDVDPSPGLSVWKRALELVHADLPNERLQKSPNFTTSMLSSGALLDVSSSTEAD